MEQMLQVKADVQAALEIVGPEEEHTMKSDSQGSPTV